MIIKFLGILDLISALIFYFSAFFSFVPGILLVPIALYLIFKGIAFIITSNYIISGLDVIAGVIIFVSLDIVFPKIVIILVVLYLIQKGIFSLL